MLGTAADADIAARLNRTVIAVQSRRPRRALARHGFSPLEVIYERPRSIGFVRKSF